MATKKDKQLAYEAGQRMMSEPPERRTAEACPFEPGTEEAQEWLQGFADALTGGVDPATLHQNLQDAMKAADHAG